jgi:1-acyl-sn-glycerol-3-phosphate acyltransferase
MIMVLRVLRSAFAWTVGLSATVGYTLSALPVSIIPGVRFFHHRMAGSWGRTCIRATGCPVNIEGLDEIDLDRRYVIMANHQSALDIPLLLGVIPAHWRTVFWAKMSLFRKPVLGWAMYMLGHMPINRTDRSTAGGMLASSIERARDGRSLLVFPEETYSPDGELLPFQRGGFVLAIKMGLPILPVGVRGTRVALPPDSRLLTRTTLDVRFGSPIPTEDLSVADRARLMELTREVIGRLSGPG